MNNADSDVVAGFGDEWTRFDQGCRTDADLQATFDRYFRLFPWEQLGGQAVGFDLGCGSGRWARFVAPRIQRLVCIDASPEALEVARAALSTLPNVDFAEASAGSLPFEDGMFDFGYSLGVLHHTPDPLVGLRDAVRLLRPGAPFLVYLYYALDNRPWWYRALWRSTDIPRRIISRFPHRLRYWTCQLIAAIVYWPLARLSSAIEKLGMDSRHIPLSEYRTKPFYVMRTDALDRFGTRIEHRFTKDGVRDLMEAGGLERITVSDSAPYWCAVGYRSERSAI